MKYERLLNSGWKKFEEKKNENNINKTLSTIKVKGYKSGINDILDEEINILDEEPSKIINDYLFGKKEPSKISIQLKKRQEMVDFILSNKTKKIEGAKDIYKNNKENLLILKKYMNNKCGSFKNLKRFISTKSNIKEFILNNSINNISVYKPNSENISFKNDFSINNSIVGDKISNSFLINSNFMNKKIKKIKTKINKEKLKNIKSSNYLTYKNSKLNNNKIFLRIIKFNREDKFKYKSKLNQSALISIEKNDKKIFNRTNSFIFQKKQKNNENESIKNNNNNFLNKTYIKLNQMNNDVNKKILKTSNSSFFDKNNVYGSVNNNKKEFFLEPDFSKKIESINDYKNIQIHHFPVIGK